jgi:hypothetical protein
VALSLRDAPSATCGKVPQKTFNVKIAQWHATPADHPARAGPRLAERRSRQSPGADAPSCAPRAHEPVVRAHGPKPTDDALMQGPPSIRTGDAVRAARALK